MKNRVISYSFFSAAHDPGTRDHYDQHSQESDRYWFNIPAVIAVNSHVYPEFVTRIYVHEKMYQHRLGHLFDRLAECPGVEILKKGELSHNKMPMIWRMLPLWESGIDVFLARDIDSIPNVPEIIASYAFVNSDFPCQGIRTHPHHSNDACILLGGLSGFKPPLLRDVLPLNFTFDDVLALGLQIDPEWKWGTDLQVLSQIFLYRNPPFVAKILDTPLGGSWGEPENKTQFPRSTLPPEDYQNVDLSGIDLDLLDICNRLTEWGGQPVDARPELARILSFENATCSFLRSFLTHDKVLGSFYLNSNSHGTQTSISVVPQSIDLPGTDSTLSIGATVPQVVRVSTEMRPQLRYQSPLELPVILMTYNRPNHTREVLEGLKRVGASNLYIFSDGPANSAAADQVRATRDLFASVTWTKPTVIERHQNHGLAQSIRMAVGQVFASEDFVILLEDDCVPGVHFLTYMFECYRRYIDNQSIFGVSGHTVAHPQNLLDIADHDIYFTPRIGSWGWGTWKDRWSKHNSDLRALVEQALNSGINFSQGGSDIPSAIQSYFSGTLKDVWTLNWLVTTYLHHGLYIYPIHSHIDNIGTDGSGVHCNPTDVFKTPMAQFAPTRFPADAVLDFNFYTSHRRYFDVVGGEAPVLAFGQLKQRLDALQKGKHQASHLSHTDTRQG